MIIALVDHLTMAHGIEINVNKAQLKTSSCLRPNTSDNLLKIRKNEMEKIRTAV